MRLQLLEKREKEREGIEKPRGSGRRGERE